MVRAVRVEGGGWRAEALPPAEAAGAGEAGCGAAAAGGGVEPCLAADNSLITASMMALIWDSSISSIDSDHAEAARRLKSAAPIAPPNRPSTAPAKTPRQVFTIARNDSKALADSGGTSPGSSSRPEAL